MAGFTVAYGIHLGNVLKILKGTGMNLKKSRVLSLLTSLLVVGSSFVALPAANAASAPVNVTFESNDTSGYALGGSADFGGNASSVVTSTAGANTTQVGKIINGGDCWSGTTFLIAPVGNQLISSNSYLATLDLYSTTPLADVKLKLEGGQTDPAREVDVTHAGNGWQTLTFDFGAGSAVAPGNYIKASLFVGFCGTDHPAEALFDNVSFPGATTADVVIPRTAPSALVNFETTDTTGYTAGGSGDFGGTVATKVSDAPAGGSAGSSYALKLASAGACWSGSTFLLVGNKASLLSDGHSTITANVYSPADAKSITLKLESSVTGANKQVTVSTVAGWQTLSFNFAGYDSAADYNKASIFPDFNPAAVGCADKTASTWYIDDIAFNGATSAALGGGSVEPVPFTGHATVRLAGMDSTNSVDHQGDADYWVSQGWARGGTTYHTKLVPVGSTQHLTFVVSDSANGSPLANTTVTLVLGKAYADSSAKLHVGSAVAGGAGTECWCGNHQATVTGVTNAQGLVSFDMVSDDVAADAADFPGSNLAVAPTGKHLFSQVAAWVTSVTEDSVDVIDFNFFKPADVVPTPTITTRVTGIDSTNAAVGSTEGWAQYYAGGLRFFERGVTVGSTTHMSYTVTADGQAYANKTVHLLLGKTYSGSTANVTVNGVNYPGTGDQKTIDLTTDANGVVTFDVVNNNFTAQADAYQAGNVLHPQGGKHLFVQLALVGEKGNQDVLDILDLNYYAQQDAPAPTVYNVRLADWNASNSFDGTHVWGDGGLGNWFDANTGYFAHYVKAGTTFNLRYKITNAATGALAPNGTVVDLYLGAAWSGSNAHFTVNGVNVSGVTAWGANGQLNQAATTATVSNGYITVPVVALDDALDATPNPGNPKANPTDLNPLFMQIKTNVQGNAITHQDWVNIVVTQANSAAPTITSVSATSGKKGQAIDIVGTNLGDALGSNVVLYTAATSKLAAVSQSVTVLSVNADGTRMTVASPANAQKGSFKVTTSGGTATAASTFSASATTTTKPSITLTASLIKEVGSTFTLNGTNIASSSAITIGGVNASFTILTANSVVVTVPAGVVSASAISVTNLGGTATSSKLVYQAAQVATVTASGRVGSTVTITGANLKATSVVFGGNKSAKPVINNGTILTVVVPTGATTGAIKITTGAGAVFTDSFTVVPPAPTVTSFTPATGKKGVSVVTVKGTNLLGATVTVGSTQVTVSSGATATTLKFVIPAGAVTGKINVTTAGGTASSANNLVVTN